MQKQIKQSLTLSEPPTQKNFLHLMALKEYIKNQDNNATTCTCPASNYIFKVNNRDAIGVVLVSLLLILNIFHTLL